MSTELQPLGVSPYIETTKLAGKTEVFLLTLDDHVENQLKFRRYVAQIALRPPLLGQLREYGHTDFDLSAFVDAEMEPLRKYLATVLSISTRWGTQDLCMATKSRRTDDEVSLCSSSSTAPATTTARPRWRYRPRSCSRSYRDSSLSGWCGGGRTNVSRGHRLGDADGAADPAILQGVAHEPVLGEAPLVLIELVGLYTKIMAEKKTPEQMMDELMISCGALTVPGVDVFAGCKGRPGMVLPVSTAHNAQQYGACHGSGVVEDKAHCYPDDRGDTFDWRGSRWRSSDGCNDGAGCGRGRRLGRGNASEEWDRGGGGHGGPRYTGNHFGGSIDRIFYSD